MFGASHTLSMKPEVTSFLPTSTGTSASPTTLPSSTGTLPSSGVASPPPLPTWDEELDQQLAAKLLELQNIQVIIIF